VLELGDAALVVRLLFLRGVILGVLRKIAMRARFRDVLNDARTIHRLAALQFVRQRGGSRRGHRNLVHLLRPSIAHALEGMRETPFRSGPCAPNAALKPVMCAVPVKGHATFIRGGEFLAILALLPIAEGALPPGRQSVFGKVTLKCADLKVSAKIG